jgi:hypothetical protein
MICPTSFHSPHRWLVLEGARQRRHHRDRLAATHAVRISPWITNTWSTAIRSCLLPIFRAACWCSGGGVIASEYAAMFAALGCKVTQA